MSIPWHGLRAAVLLLGLWWLPVSGCAESSAPMSAPRSGRSTVPPDFTVDLLVIGKDHQQRGGQSADPSLPVAYRSARYLVQPDRTLRAAVGPGVDWRGIPSAPIRLSYDQYVLIYRTWSQIRPPADGSEAPGDGGMVTYHLRVRRAQQWHQQQTTPRADPAALQLVEQLGRWAGLDR